MEFKLIRIEFEKKNVELEILKNKKSILNEIINPKI